MLAAYLIGSLLFSGIGFVAFVFGKKQARPKAMILGLILLAYPYFITDTAAMYAVGIVVTVCLFVFKD